MGVRRKRSALETVSKALVKAVADLPSADAVVRLAEYAAREPAGLRRRALLAARIAVMRRALDVPDPVVVVPPPAPEPEPEPEPVIAPVVKAPKPLSKGVMMSINLDDVARMLSAQEEAPAPPPAPASEPEPEPETVSAPVPGVVLPDPAATFAALDWEDSAARLDPGEVPGMAAADPGADWDQWAPMAESAKAVAVAEEEAPIVAAPSDAAKATPKRGKAQGMLADPGAAFAALLTGEEPAAAPEVAPASPAAEAGAALADPAAAFAALAAPASAHGSAAPAKAPKRGKAQGVLADPGAAFAALLTGEEPATAAEVAPAPPAADAGAALADPAAAFAALAAPATAHGSAAPAKAPKRGKAQGVLADPGAAFAALMAGEEPAAAPGKGKGAGMDLSAQFAAMKGLGDGSDVGR